MAVATRAHVASRIELVAVALVLIRADRALLERLRAEWILDVRLRALVRDLQEAEARTPDWILAARLTRERGDWWLLNELSAAPDACTTLDAEQFVARLRWRAERLQLVRAACRAADERERTDRLARALEAVAP